MRFSFLVLLVPISMVVVRAADPALSRQQGDAFAKKVGVIVAHSDAGAGTRRTPVTENELNSWFAFNAQPLLPKGVAEPTVSIIGQGKLSGRAIVDLDAVAKQKGTGGTFNPWSYVAGRVPVTVTGTLRTTDGVGRFELESAYVSSVPVPKTLLQELVSYYSRTPDHPAGIGLDDSFNLPANIRAIEVGQGQAVVVQ